MLALCDAPAALQPGGAGHGEDERVQLRRTCLGSWGITAGPAGAADAGMTRSER